MVNAASCHPAFIAASRVDCQSDMQGITSRKNVASKTSGSSGHMTLALHIVQGLKKMGEEV